MILLKNNYSPICLLLTIGIIVALELFIFLKVFDKCLIRQYLLSKNYTWKYSKESSVFRF